MTGGNFIGMKKNKKALLDIFLVILLGFLCVYPAQKEKSKSFEQVQDKGSVAVLEESSQQEDEEAAWDKEQVYQTLDIALESAFQEEVKDELISNLARELAEKWKGDFVPQTGKISGFPEELALKLEEILYHSDTTEMEDPESPYQKWVQEMGGDEYLLDLEDLRTLFPEITEFREEIQSEKEACFCLEFTYLDVPPNCLHVFHLSMKEGQDNYIFAWSAAKVRVRVTERSGDTFKCLSEFGATTDDEEGRVVRCGDEFYYISRYYTFNGKDCEGISLCRLTDDWEREILSIRYLPETFVWEKIYAAEESPDVQKKMNVYIERLKEILLQGNYLGIKGQFKEADLYSGDEIRSDFIMVPSLYAGHSGAAYPVDLANCDRPVYVWKGHDSDRANSLQVRFYYVDYRTGDRVEFENAGIDGYGGDNGMDLIQMWFKEIEGKVYTFRLYYVSDYSYMLNVSLLEKSNVKMVRTYLLSPEKAFIVEGGTYQEVYGR